MRDAVVIETKTYNPTEEGRPQALPRPDPATGRGEASDGSGSSGPLYLAHEF